MEPHLIVFDLDGTVLPKLKEFPEETREVLLRAKKAGHKLMINTARPWNMARHIYELLELDTPIGLENGAELISPNDDNFKDIYNILNENQTYTITNEIMKYNEPDTIIIEYKNDFYQYGDTLNPYFKYRADVSRVINFDKNSIPHIEASRIIVIHKDSDILNKYIQIAKNDKDIITHLLVSNNKEKAIFNRCFIQNKRANKWYSALAVAEYYNIPLENIYTFGDEWNDVMMTKEAEHGYGICGSLAAKSSHFITNFSCKDKGVARVIAKILL